MKYVVFLKAFGEYYCGVRGWYRDIKEAVKYGSREEAMKVMYSMPRLQLEIIDKTEIVSQEIREFFESHKALNVKIIEQEAEIPQGVLWKVVKNKIYPTLPAKHWPKLEVILRKYGWKS